MNLAHSSGVRYQNLMQRLQRWVIENRYFYQHKMDVNHETNVNYSPLLHPFLAYIKSIFIVVSFLYLLDKCQEI